MHVVRGDRRTARASQMACQGSLCCVNGERRSLFPLLSIGAVDVARAAEEPAPIDSHSQRLQQFFRCEPIQAQGSFEIYVPTTIPSTGKQSPVSPFFYHILPTPFNPLSLPIVHITCGGNKLRFGAATEDRAYGCGSWEPACLKAAVSQQGSGGNNFC
jgi:hypothetical protein